MSMSKQRKEKQARRVKASPVFLTKVDAPGIAFDCTELAQYQSKR
jgi:hypothetical protein